MHFLANWFVKITGVIPYLILMWPKIFYEDRKVQGRRIKGKAIVISNHNSIMDVAVMMFTFPGRTLRCVTAELMFKKNFMMSFFLHAIGAIRVDRDAHDFAFLEKSKRILSRGGVVEIYPEARLPRAGEERPLPFKPSAVYMALESGAPIIPVYHSRRGFVDRDSAVLIGKPIDVRELFDDTLDEKQNIEIITEIVRGKIIELGKELERKKEEEKRDRI